MTDHVLQINDGPLEPVVKYSPVLSSPMSPSDGVWLTGAIYPLSNSPHSGRTLRGFVPQGERTGAEPEAGSGWRVVVVGALLVGGLWGVAVAWTLLALVRAM